MSTNQAFIKAYRHDQAQPLPTGPAREMAAPQRGIQRAAAARSARLATVGIAESYGATVAYASPGLVGDTDLDSGQLTIQASSLTNIDASPYAPDAPEFIEPDVETVPTAVQRVPHGPTSAKRPLSSFMKQAGTPLHSAPLSLRPGTTIAALHWPAACRNLLQRHGQIFDRIIETLLAQADEGRSLVGVLGLFRGIGCTTTTLCLAARAAECGRNIAVVDGHFEAPQLASCIDAQPTAWWQDVLERGAALGDALVRAENDRIDLLPLDPYIRAMPPALQLTATAGVLRHAYDLALVDLGTFFDPDSQPMALSLVEHMRIESALVVAGPNSYDPRDLETVAQRLGECGCELLGTIDNRVVS